MTRGVAAFARMGPIEESPQSEAHGGPGVGGSRRTAGPTLLLRCDLLPRTCPADSDHVAAATGG